MFSTVLLSRNNNISKIRHSSFPFLRILRWNPSGNWVILIFSGKKPCTRIVCIIKEYCILFYIFHSNSLSVITPKKISYGSPRKWMSNFTKLHLTHKIFIILPVFSLFLWNLTFLFSDSDGKFSLVLLQNFFVFNLLPGFFHYYSYRCFTTVAKK